MKRQKPGTVAKVNLKSRDNENSSLHENEETLGSRDKRSACWYRLLALGSPNLLPKLSVRAAYMKAGRNGMWKHVYRGSRWETGSA